jgi:hypothetical protein
MKNSISRLHLDSEIVFIADQPLDSTSVACGEHSQPVSWCGYSGRSDNLLAYRVRRRGCRVVREIWSQKSASTSDGVALATIAFPEKDFEATFCVSGQRACSPFALELSHKRDKRVKLALSEAAKSGHAFFDHALRDNARQLAVGKALNVWAARNIHRFVSSSAIKAMTSGAGSVVYAASFISRSRIVCGRCQAGGERESHQNEGSSERKARKHRREAFYRKTGKGRSSVSTEWPTCVKSGCLLS